MRPANAIIVIRSVIGVLLAALAVVNFVWGRVVFGVLFAALAVMNVVMTVYISRRRARSGRRFRDRADR
jgi:O-antigen/teichoic acid export membrane protein